MTKCILNTNTTIWKRHLLSRVVDLAWVIKYVKIYVNIAKFVHIFFYTVFVAYKYPFNLSFQTFWREIFHTLYFFHLLFKNQVYFFCGSIQFVQVLCLHSLFFNTFLWLWDYIWLWKTITSTFPLKISWLFFNMMTCNK